VTVQRGVGFVIALIYEIEIAAHEHSNTGGRFPQDDRHFASATRSF
jgi:hypothetical protein